MKKNSESNLSLLTWLAVAACCCIAWSVAPARGGDWPQILGPNRNGVAVDEKLAASWPKAGPKAAWQRKIGSGFAGVAVSGGRTVLFHRVDDEEIAEAMDANTGESLWKTAFPTRFASVYSSDHGPRCVPLIHKGNVYLFGASGNLHCVSLAKGKKIWSRSAYNDFGAKEGYFGAGSSPIALGDNLLVNVGAGRNGAGIVAFSLKTGETVWKATQTQASYSSPIAVTIDGAPQVIFVTRYETVSMHPGSGKVHWKFPFGKRGPTVNAASPLVLDGHLFLSASYGLGAVYAKLNKTGLKVVWRSDEVMSSQFTTCVAEGGYLYGIDGRADQGEARLRCINPQNGEVVWSKTGLGKGSLLLADGKLIVQSTSGQITLAQATPKGYRQLASAKATSAKTFALPALANGKLYVRGPRLLKCLEVGR